MYHGQTTKDDVNDRWNKYKRLQCKRQPKLYNALKKYGWNNFLAEVIDTTPQNQEQLDELEIFYTTKFDSMNNGYNCDPGGRGGKKSDETKMKMSEARKGSKNPMFGKMGKLNPNFGKLRSEETKRKIADSKMNKILSDESKLKISMALSGRKLTTEIREKISKSKIGHNVSNESKQKISESLFRFYRKKKERLSASPSGTSS